MLTSLDWLMSSNSDCWLRNLVIVVFINYRGTAKWDAWSSKKGMDSETAKKEYIGLVEKMKEKHGLI